MINVAALPDSLAVDPGSTGLASIIVTNTSKVIDAYAVEVFGVDPDWVEVTPNRFSLFPGETQNVDLSLRLPDEYPASVRPVAISVKSENDPTRFELATVQLEIRQAVETSVRIDPTMITAGRSATYGMIVSNDGNSPVRATGFGVDPEDLAEFVIEPPSVIVPPGRDQVIQIEASGGRAWFGQPRARTFTVGVDAERRVETVATLIQRPRIGRWLIALLGLLTAAAIFAAVLSRTFDKVVEDASVNDQVLDAALASGAAGGAVVPANPGSITGTLTSTTSALDGAAAQTGFAAPAQASGAGSAFGVAGVQIELFLPDDPATPVATAATDDAGQFTLTNLGDGEYKMRLSGAGYPEVWYRSDGPAVPSAADASKIKVELGKEKPLGEIQIGAIPATIQGTISGDAAGATLKLVRPGVLDPDTPAVVAEVEIGPDGSFVLPDIPSPADYEMIVEKPGSATVRRNVTLEPGEGLGDIGIELSPAEGEVTGLVTGPDGPLGGVSIVATDGSHTVETVTFTEGQVGGFVLRNLATPGRYTVTASTDGFVPDSNSIVLEAGQREGSFLSMSLVPASSRIEGVVLRDGLPSGDVVVSISGGDIEQTTRPVSDGPLAGQFFFHGLPAPATYTLTFSGGGTVPQVRVISLDPSGSVGVTILPTIDLRVENRTLRGEVHQDDEPVGGAQLILTDGTFERTALSTTVATPTAPAGSFVFTDVAPGIYTLTARREGASDSVELVTIVPGEEPRFVRLGLARQASVTGTVIPGVCELKVRLYRFDKFDSEWEQETLLLGGSYEFTAVSAPTGYLIAIHTLNSEAPLATTSVESVPSAETVAPVIDMTTLDECKG